MRLRSRSYTSLPIIALILNAAVTSAAPLDRAHPLLVLSFHGTRALDGDRSKETGWGGGGLVRYSVANGLKLWACVERVRLARDGSSFVSTVTPWTIGAEVGPQVPRRIEPLLRLGLGMYRLQRRGEYVNFFTRRPTQYSDSGVFSGLNIGGGGHARLMGGAILDLSVTFHQSFSRESALDAPSLGEVQLVNFRAGLGYPIK
jgi:hypothetical protein